MSRLFWHSSILPAAQLLENKHPNMGYVLRDYFSGSVAYRIIQRAGKRTASDGFPNCVSRQKRGEYTQNAERYAKTPQLSLRCPPFAIFSWPCAPLVFEKTGWNNHRRVWKYKGRLLDSSKNTKQSLYVFAPSVVLPCVLLQGCWLALLGPQSRCGGKLLRI